MLRQATQNLITALYPRLSHEDELQGESNSISNQVNFLLLRPSGIRKKTASYHHNRSRQIPTVKSGGGVKRAMIMRLL